MLRTVFSVKDDNLIHKSMDDRNIDDSDNNKNDVLGSICPKASNVEIYNKFYKGICHSVQIVEKAMKV